MSDPRGFLTIRERELAPKRPVAVRLQDWREVVDPANPAMVARQASRCMDCGVAFCHQGCPLGNLIPEWNDLLHRGHQREALERLHETNNFPEFTGRACPAPCESACVLGINQPAVTIKQVENHLIDEGFARGWVRPQPPSRLTGTTVAVVGSGPAGLAAAQQLTRAGHTVVVYERDEVAGGLLSLGIPSFKLEKTLVERRIAQLKAEGTRFRTGVHVGEDLSWGELRRRFDAVIVATGATLPRPLSVPGDALPGVLLAMPYLTAANRWSPAELEDDPRSAAGKRVVVVGGGDTGADCVGTAHRQGARSVTSLAIGKKPAEQRSENEPWPTHPTLFEVTSSHEEGGERRYRAATVELVAGPDGAVGGVRVAETAFTPAGRVPMPGTEQLFEADLVLVALGFSGPEPIRDPAFTLPVNTRGAFARGTDFETDVPGVFVAGDAGRGQSLIVWAIAEGRAAAAAVDSYLTGGTRLPSPVTAHDTAFS